MRLVIWIPGTRAWRRRRDIALCKEAIARVDEVVDQELPPGRAKVLHKHVEACRRCTREAEAVAELKEAIRRVACHADPAVVERLEDLGRRLCRGEHVE
jgi:hypothetical protein